MRSHWVPVLMLCALASASCQPSQSPVQTQAAQSAFETAVAAAGTQAAPPEPTRTPAPTRSPTPTIEPSPTGPIPTLDAWLLQGMASGFQKYLESRISSFRPSDGVPYEAHVMFVKYEYYDSGKAAVMDVGVQKSDVTREGSVEVAALNAFIAIYADNAPVPDTNAWGQVLVLPRQLRVLRVHIYDSGNKERFRLTGNWEDVIAYGKGSLTKEEFMSRMKFEKAAD